MEAVEDLFEGLRRVTVSNPHLSLSMLPEIGGKIISLRRNNRNWLHLNPNFRLSRPIYGSSFVKDWDSGGWDECLPSIAGEIEGISGEEIPDHGEVWGLPWSCEVERSEEGITLQTAVISEKFGFELRRSIIVPTDKAEIRMVYALINRKERPFPYLWSAHPILNIEEGMRISLPADSPVRINSPDNTPTGLWPFLAPNTPIDQIPSRTAAIARKLFVGPLTEGWVSVSTLAGETLRFSFDVRELPYVGLWQNYGGWSGNESFSPYYNLGVEPCSGMPDSLSTAQAWGTCPALPPRHTSTWTITLSFS
jgi:galactose mutarotase-like enzyme